MIAPYEPLTPVQIEARLFNLTIARSQAEAAFTETSDALVTAQEDLTMAKARLEFAVADARTADDVPVVGRGPDEVTVAYRDGWVVKRTRAERLAVLEATADVRRKRAAMDAARRHITEVSEQMMAAQSLNKSVTEAYRGIGGVR